MSLFQPPERHLHSCTCCFAALLNLASATSVKWDGHQDPLSFTCPQGAHTAHTKSCLQLTACSGKHRKKQECGDSTYWPNTSTTEKASQNNKVIALSFSFPWAIGKWCQFQEYQARKWKGCQLSSANRELGLMQLKRKTKTPASFSAAELPDTPWCCLICSGRAE